MKKSIVCLSTAGFLLALAAFTAEEPLAWQGWSDGVFQKAKKENKFVILDLEAVWCHWCHVMANTTYKDPAVVELLRSKYLTIRVDQDANPDISLRYEDWGWPATIVFAPDGTELVKRRGYIPPKPMASLLEAIIKDPTPGPSVLPDIQIKPAENAYLSPELKTALQTQHLDVYDPEFGGWGRPYKFIEPYSLEYAMTRANAGDKEEERMAQLTLNQALNLLDGEWGGFYQYSDERDWKSPHYEKIMSVQSVNLRLFAMTGALWNDSIYVNFDPKTSIRHPNAGAFDYERSLGAAKKTADYAAEFWTSLEGAFYTSQDADVDESTKGHDFYALKNDERRKLGKMPRIDTHVYARENGWMIESLTSLYAVTGDSEYLEAARRSAAWILKNRSLNEGGFRHDAEDRAGPYLGDTLSMGRAFLSLYEATGERQWLNRSEESARFVNKNFKFAEGGFVTALIPANAQGDLRKPIRQLAENVDAARWLVRLFHYTGKMEYKTQAAHSMKYLASPALLQTHAILTGVLLADPELNSDPLHITVVGGKDDDKAKALYLAALAYPAFYKRIEWWDKREGALPNPDVEYPALEQPAAFVCTNQTCSSPLFSVNKLRAWLAKLQGK